MRNTLVKLHNLIFCTSFYFDSRVKSYGTYSLKNPERIKLNGKLVINDYVYINGLGYVEFGDNVILSAGSKVISTGLEISEFGFTNNHVTGKIIIGSNVQIGAGAIIIQDVSICDNVIIGAGSFVNKNINSPGVYAGTPFKKIRDFKYD